ncbi:MAG TPA: TolC family protein [Steroidobacteraceae bacterium]|nr:TolC family protein [Steroidobacteraceae bacterium]
MFCASLGASAPAFAQASLAIAEAERLALSRDADLVRLEADREALLERAVAAGELPDPRMRIGAQNVPTDSFELDAEDMTMLEVGVSQMFPPGDSRQLASLRYEREAAALEARIADRRRTVVRELRQAWIEDAALAAAEELVREQIDWFAPLVANALARYGNAQLRQLDVVQATLAEAQLKERLLALRTERADARARLSRWLDSAADEIATAIPAPRDVPPLAVLEERLHGHPSNLDFERRIAAAETGEALEQQRYRPEWELDLSYGFRDGRGMDGGSRSDMVSAMVSFSVPLFAGDRQDRAVAAARAETRSVRAMHDDHQRELYAELRAVVDVARSAREIEELYESRLIALSESANRAATLAYANDLAEFAELVETGTALLELQLGKVEAAAKRALAETEIAYLTGETP